MNSDKLECLVDFDYDLIQDDCHWDLDRYFRLTFKVLDPTIASSKELYYRIGDYEDPGNNVLAKYTKISTATSNTNLFTVNSTTWIYHLRISEIDYDTLASARADDGHIKITALIKCGGETTYAIFSHYLELPPRLAATRPNTAGLPNIQTDYVKSNPGEFKCDWSAAETYVCSANNVSTVDSVEGYSIEIFHKPEGSATFSQLIGLKWDPTELSNNKYKLIKDSSYAKPTFTASPDLNKDFSLASPHTRSELYIETPLKTEFYFIPKSLGIKPGDSYKILIYPYSHYEGALISTQGVSSDDIDTPKGIVRVKTANGWVEGQVWVMTESGWKNAEVIYAMTEDGWKEAQ